MVVKWALAALIALGVAIVAVAAIEVALAPARDASASGPHDRGECSCGPGDAHGASAGFSQTGHAGASPASWLIGLGLVVVLARLGEDGEGLDGL
jgi:hypothetical protein